MTIPLRMLHVTDGGFLDSFVVEAVMLHESGIFRSHNRNGQRGRNLVERYPFVVKRQGFVIGRLLCQSDEHQGCEPHGHPSQHDNRKDSGGEEHHHYPLKRFFNET